MVSRARLMATKRKATAKRKSARRRASPTDVALASLAHEIRTPLTGILALAELLHASDLPEREQRWAEAIRGAADHLARLTSLVVDSAKADAAGFALREEVFSPRDLARSVAGLLTARAESKGLEVTSEIASGLPSRVIGDVVRLRGALENLIDNALKFTDRGRIAFAASSAGAGRGRTRLTFAVSDSGIGIAPAELRRLFHPFVQANADIARRYGGAGLGLMFVKRTAEAMGGGLQVTSKPSRGSTFRMTVLVRNEAAAARRGGDATVVTGLRVLCVEDNPYGRVVLGTVLRELGHSVSFVGRGEAAVETVTRHGHDVVLMDVALPGDVDGVEATRRIRALPGPAGRIPIIGVSGRSEADDERAARGAGMDAYLRKPASPAELHAALQAAARFRRA
ncbi:MAG: response regulator [Xanthobacteraceae bacterium]|nr:response regulator [Xanthobacteraceae bacterium]